MGWGRGGDQEENSGARRDTRRPKMDRGFDLEDDMVRRGACSSPERSSGSAQATLPNNPGLFTLCLIGLQIKVFPAKIFFFCLQPSPEGGQTSMVRSDVVVERMEEEVPRVVEKLELGGMRFVLHRSRSVWQRMLRTQKEREAEERALESLACNSVRFNDDGSADFNYGPINPIREYEGERVWFNSIAGVVGEQELQATFDDGSPLPMDAVTAYQKITEENCVDVSWRKGDVLLVNNLKVQHARRPGRPPRVLLVSLCN